MSPIPRIRMMTTTIPAVTIVASLTRMRLLMTSLPRRTAAPALAISALSLMQSIARYVVDSLPSKLLFA